MTKSGNKRSWMVAILFTLMVMIAAPVISYAQGRGNGHGRGKQANQSWKCGKFVNCHDARDGVWTIADHEVRAWDAALGTTMMDGGIAE
ncbi:MAG TPA: hypothetical protein VJT71_21060 [Pyrinomonadaceae bacterium]|nr:hypothetical protein [Pyrinomonadaceae bacterium]